MAANNIRNREVKHFNFVFDIGFPMELEILQNVTDVMLDVLTVICFTNDWTKHSTISLLIVNTDLQIVLKNVISQGNFTRIAKAFESMKNTANISGRPQEVDFKDYLLLALNTAMQNLKDLYMVNELWSQEPASEVCIITQKNGLLIKEYIDSLRETQHLNTIKSIAILEVQTKCGTPYTMKNAATKIDLYQVPISNKNIIEYLMKSWLFSSKYDKEHVHLIFPDVTIKCDIEDVVINTTLLPWSGRFQLSPGSITNLKTPKSNTAEMQVEAEIYNLVVVNRISRYGMCESQIFGNPMKVFAAQCPAEGLSKAYDENQQIFLALCSVLMEKEEYLIVKMKCDVPYGFFVLIPSEEMLLLKSVVTNELQVPPSAIERAFKYGPTDSSKSKMVNYLNEVPLQEEYEPLENSSGIYSALRQLPQNKNVKITY